MSTIWTRIVATGSYIPERIIPNSHFLRSAFHDANGERVHKRLEETISKFEAITGIGARRYVSDDLQTSDIAFLAAKDALDSGDIDKESLDYIVVAHNFGDVSSTSRRSDSVPALAARVKNRLDISNPGTVAFDLLFGCPGWLEAMIQMDKSLRIGGARRALVIGAETLSRVCDPHDRDSMIYSDGAGACVLEAIPSESAVGIVAHSTRSDTQEHVYLLRMGRSYNPAFDGDDLFLKMEGHRLYEYALRTVPHVVKECLDRAELSLSDVAKVLIHQANAKMDDAILMRLFKLCGNGSPAPTVMPMTISWLGNSSVATLPTLLDLLLKGRLEEHRIASGQRIVMASVGAGMNANAIVYRMP